MKKNITRITTVNQSAIVMPTYALGGVACAHVDAPVRERAFDASRTGATPGTHVWSPPPR